MIYREEDRLLWKRKNTLPTQAGLVLTPDDKDGVELKHELGVKISFTKDQFYEMAQAGAAHFGDQVQFSPLPVLCPLCGGETEIVIHDNFNNDCYTRRQCKDCGLSGPVSPTKHGATEAFSRLTLRIPGDQP
jgi:hypothetical protein